MRTDSIFYKIFETLPDTLFALIGEPSELAKDYEFKSIEVKELAFRIDGVFISAQFNHPIYFVEVQFQKDASFYWRFFCEIFLVLGHCVFSEITATSSIDRRREQEIT
jgi:predicted transposase/invertase (TIGR01784 family)